MRIGPELRMAVVGSPAYFARHPPPGTPQELTGHACVNLRLPTHGSIYAWEPEKDRHELKVRVEGPLVVNAAPLLIQAALAGFGLAYVFENRVQDHLADGRLLRVLEEWCPPNPGYHLYYPSRRRPSP